MERDDKTITEQMTDIVNEVCSTRCKYGMEYNAKETITDEDSDRFYAEYCAKCPLMKI